MALPLIEMSRNLAEDVDALEFGAPVAHVYNPLRYAVAPHERFLDMYGQRTGRIVLLGMNPGPFGMAQTGVPFGEVSFVRDWMGVHEKVERPADEHPKRPVLGFEHPRSEVSGARLWGWAAQRFGTASRFFERFFVWNHCPLLFLGETGRNLTPDKLGVAERRAVQETCDRALRRALEALQPERVIGIGMYAERCAERVWGERGVPIGRILHPSPASPAANRGWAPQAEVQLKAQGVEIP